MTSASLAGSSVRSAAAVSWLSDCCSLLYCSKSWWTRATSCSVCGVGSSSALRGADGGDEEAVFVVDFGGAGALDAFDEHLDVAVGHADGLHDVADDADGVDVVGGGLVDGGVVLGGEEDAAVAVEGFFERADGGLAADDEGRHHVRKDHHLADGHHREFALGAVEDVAFVVCHRPPD